MREFAFDLRYVFRSLHASPGFTFIAVLTLAIGIGPNTAIFTLLYQLLWRPVPHVSAPETLVLLRRQESGSTDTAGFSHLGYKDYRDHNTVFEGLMAYRGAGVDMATGARPESLDALLVTGNYFRVLGIRAAQGRLLGEEDDEPPGGHPVVVLSHDFWTRRFGRNAQILGTRVTLNRFIYTVVGVAPPGFRGTEWGSKADVWLPLSMEPQVRPTFPTLNGRLFTTLDVIGRLKPGVSRVNAQAQLDVLAARFEEGKAAEQKARLAISPGLRMPPEWWNNAVTFVSVLTGIVMLVLMVACANVANLMLVRTSLRSAEIAMRRALGAGSGSLIRLQIVESLAIALPAGAAGYVFAIWLSAFFGRLFGELATIESPDVTLPPVLFYTLALSVITSLAFGVAPVVTANRIDILAVLKRAASGGDPRRTGVRRVLVVTQVALSLMGIVFAALFVRSLLYLQSVNPGYNPEGVFYLQTSLRPLDYSEARGRQFYRDALDRIRSLPGVRAVALADSMPPGWMWTADIEIERRPLRSGERPVHVGKNVVGPGYFNTVGAPLIAGRAFDDRDGPNAPRVAIINETMARQLWRGDNAVGQRFRWTGVLGPRPWVEVIGVTRDGKYEYLGEPVRAHVCLPFSQNYEPDMKIVVSSSGTARAMPVVIRQFLALDPALPVPEVRTAREHIAESLTLDRFNAYAISLAGILAVFLAATGLYGVISYSVAQRTREIGIRVALGATGAQVIRPLLADAAKLTGTGVLLGTALALFAARVVRAQLTGVRPADPISYASGAVLLIAIAVAACWLPARRALRVDPAETLRCE